MTHFVILRWSCCLTSCMSALSYVVFVLEEKREASNEVAAASAFTKSPQSGYGITKERLSKFIPHNGGCFHISHRTNGCMFAINKTIGESNFGELDFYPVPLPYLVVTHIM